MAAGEGKKVEEKGAAAAKKEHIGVDAADEEKGARVVEKGEMEVKATNKGKGVMSEGKTIEMAVEKGEEDSTVMGEEEGETAEGKGKGKKREPAMVKKDLTVDWELESKWKVATVKDGEEGSKTRRESRLWRCTRRDQGPAVEKEKEEKEKDTTAATEKTGEKTIFLFNAATATRKMIPQVSPAAATATVAEKMITLVSSKGQPFRMSEAAARLSMVLADMIDNGCASGNIPLSKVDDRALAIVIRYCDKHAATEHGVVDEAGDNTNTTASKNKKALDEWDRKLVRDLTQGALYDLIIAAHFLNIKGLLDACCQKVADMIKKKTPAQVRKTFGIVNDFTVEEEEVLRNESPWLFDEEDEEDA